MDSMLSPLQLFVMDVQSVFTGRGRDVEMSTESARERCRQMVPRHFEPCWSVGLSSERFGLVCPPGQSMNSTV